MFCSSETDGRKRGRPPPPLHKHTHTHTYARAFSIDKAGFQRCFWQQELLLCFLDRTAVRVERQAKWLGQRLSKRTLLYSFRSLHYLVVSTPRPFTATPAAFSSMSLHYLTLILFHVFTLPHSYSLPCLYSTSLLFSYMSSHYLVVSTATPATFSSMSLHYLTLILLHVFTLPHSYSLPCLYATSLVVSSATPATSHPTVPHPPSRTSPRNLHPATKAEKWLWPWPNKLWARHLRGVGGPIYMNDYSLIWVWVCSGPEWEDRFCFRSMKCFPGGNIPVPLP